MTKMTKIEKITGFLMVNQKVVEALTASFKSVKRFKNIEPTFDELVQYSYYMISENLAEIIVSTSDVNLLISEEIIDKSISERLVVLNKNRFETSVESITFITTFDDEQTLLQYAPKFKEHIIKTEKFKYMKMFN